MGSRELSPREGRQLAVFGGMSLACLAHRDHVRTHDRILVNPKSQDPIPKFQRPSWDLGVGISTLGFLTPILAEIFLQLRARTLVITGVAVRLRQRLRIVGSDLVLEILAASNRPDPLDQVERVAVGRPRVVEPRRVVEAGRIDDERVALEAADGVTEIRRFALRRVFACVRDRFRACCRVRFARTSA